MWNDTVSPLDDDMSTNGHMHEPLPPPSEEATGEHMEALIDALCDSPETVISTHFLRRGAADVLVVGDPTDLEAVIVQLHILPSEPSVFGTSVDAVISLIPHLTGWACINVPADMADALMEPVAREADAAGVRLLDDVFHVLEAPSTADVQDARILGPDDLGLLESAADLIEGAAFDHLIEALDWGHVAAIERSRRIVALAHTFAISPDHADIGVVVAEDHRRKGLATAVGAAVSNAVHAGGRTPVWSAGGTNLGSMRAAQSIGFKETSRRMYLIPDFDDES